MQKPRSRSGGSTIMRRVPTLHCSGPHHQNSPVRQGKRPNRAFQRSRKFLLQTGTNSGVGSEAGNFYFRPVQKQKKKQKKTKHKQNTTQKKKTNKKRTQPL